MMPYCMKRRCNRVAEQVKVHNETQYAACTKHLRYMFDQYYKAVEVTAEIGKRQKSIELIGSGPASTAPHKLRQEIRDLERYGTANPSVLTRLTGGWL